MELKERNILILIHSMLRLRIAYKQIIGSKQKVLILGSELFAWNSSPDESQRTEEGRRIENTPENGIILVSLLQKP